MSFKTKHKELFLCDVSTWLYMPVICDWNSHQIHDVSGIVRVSKGPLTLLLVKVEKLLREPLK